MIAHSDYTYLTADQYLEWEQKQPIKHEYVNGEVFAMAGASNAHVTIALNLATGLRNHVRGSGCRVFMSDMKVKVPDLRWFYYPDVMVTCDPRDRTANYAMAYPKLIVEVLSDSTEAFNRGRKFADYRQLESLEEYVLIEPGQISVECFRRNAQGQWVLYPYAEGAQVHLASIDFTCPIAMLYEDVEFATQS